MMFITFGVYRQECSGTFKNDLITKFGVIMRSLIIILSAIGAAILVMSFVKRWQIKQAKKTGKSPDKIEIATSPERLLRL